MIDCNEYDRFARDKDARTMPVDELVTRSARLTQSDRQKLVDQTVTKLGSATSLIHQDDRVALARIAVALLPDTEAAVTDALRCSKSKLDLELHFSLFCFLDHARPQASHDFADRIASMVGDYIKVLEVDPVQSGWMAADLLGDHLPLAESLPVLDDLASYQTLSEAAANAVRHGLIQAERRADPAQLTRVREASRYIGVRPTPYQIKRREWQRRTRSPIVAAETASALGIGVDRIRFLSPDQTEVLRSEWVDRVCILSPIAEIEESNRADIDTVLAAVSRGESEPVVLFHSEDDVTGAMLIDGSILRGKHWALIDSGVTSDYVVVNHDASRGVALDFGYKRSNGEYVPGGVCQIFIWDDGRCGKT